MPRSHFINPYTFIPLSSQGPLIRDVKQSTHAWFEKETFTGRIECQLILYSPTAIFGDSNSQSETMDEPAKISAYRYNNRLAIPGSRIRGHLLNLMRAINSSPVTAFEKRVMLDRRNGLPRKGILLQNSGSWEIHEIKHEVLVAHRERTGPPELQNPCAPEYEPVAFNSGEKSEIPKFNCTQKLSTQGLQADLYYANPAWRPTKTRRHKRYLAQKGTGTPRCRKGRWVKLSSWSGQDGNNYLKDIKGNRRRHWNSWHLVDLNSLVKDSLPINKAIMDTFNDCIDEMSSLIEERDKTEWQQAKDTKKAKNISSGTFVYFMTDENNNVTSIGRHYHYLEQQGTVEDKVENANSRLASHSGDRCAVSNLAGWASDSDDPGMKGRIWVEMALDPGDQNVPLEYKNLRILSSQPPKAACFYLENGDYQDPASRIRGRKFYWHDPQWEKPMWDNKDLQPNEKRCAFENPEPLQNRKQWVKAELIMANEQTPVTFDFTIRLMNATSDELNLLLTSMVGLSAMVDNGFICSENLTSWSHKIGHARPFIGSGIIRIKKVEQVKFNKDTYLPELSTLPNKKILDDIKGWQQKTLKGSHIKMIERVMHPQGAYVKDELGKGIRITYPYFRDAGLSWISQDRKDHPKTFEWFRKNKTAKKKLPKPEPGTSQALPVDPFL